MKKIIYTLLIVLLNILPSYSQTYNYNRSTSTYTDLVADSKLSGSTGWLDFDYTINQNYGRRRHLLYNPTIFPCLGCVDLSMQ